MPILGNQTGATLSPSNTDVAPRQSNSYPAFPALLLTESGCKIAVSEITLVESEIGGKRSPASKYQLMAESPRKNSNERRQSMDTYDSVMLLLAVASVVLTLIGIFVGFHRRNAGDK